MVGFPKTLRGRVARIAAYEKALRAEKRRYKAYDDSGGKRYALGPLYLLADDLDGALKHYNWFKKNFADDMGEPLHQICWALTLRRANKEQAASEVLRRSMASCLWLFPLLLDGRDAGERAFSKAHPNLPARLTEQHLDYVEPPLRVLWTQDELEWAKTFYTSAESVALRKRIEEIELKLEVEQPGPQRNQLIAELFDLKR